MVNPKLGKTVRAKGDIRRAAYVSDDGTYRYWLIRQWAKPGETLRLLVYIMLNPSAADVDDDDSTIMFCMGQARHQGFNTIAVVNLYAWRGTEPKDLRSAGFPAGPENDRHVREVLGLAHRVICAWGNNAQEAVATKMLDTIRECGHTPMALKVLTSGAPRHPLYQAHATDPVEYDGKSITRRTYAWARSKRR